LKKREETGKKVKALRAQGMVTSIVYGEKKKPVMTMSEYVETEKVLGAAGYHSPIDLEIDGKKQLAIVKNVQVDAVSRRIINVEFQAISANEVVEATTPIVITGFEGSEAARTYHFAMTQAIEELEVKAKPSDLPKELEVDASQLKTVEDKIVLGDIKLPKGVELADKELDMEQVVASLYDPAVEAAEREAEAEAEPVDAADVPADNGSKPDEEEA
jgi:large subunit ribosomal protein L25